ncbi:MAG: peptidylprolyl isomerase [Gammaproteobacteria bacterium]|nr:peptidylprolyl isomerase [Gammaproteobacteria bacterium]
MIRIYFIVAISLIYSYSMASGIEPVEIYSHSQTINFLDDVKPILDKRCVTCHSCYNSPCQAKFSSFEGIDRGASKVKLYDSTRLKAIAPTRLFIDAQTTKEWRQKSFFSITQGNKYSSAHNDSIMMHMLHEKKNKPQNIGSYDPENDELVCPKNSHELKEYFTKKPNHGMPYGLPALENNEHEILTHWLQQGARGPNAAEQKKLLSINPPTQKEVSIWETFLNKKDAKHKVTARYLYEHFYIAHLNFQSSPNEFFKIVRSSTPAPKAIKIIPNLRPFDDPGAAPFYYRLQKIHSTIVHKTHIVLKLSNKKLNRIKHLFIESKWQETPHEISYDAKLSANPFLSFAQIPPKTRYQFLLDNAHFILETFIKGPVCRGQIALNVINDHFWIMFKDPAFDITVQNPDFLIEQAENLSLPIKHINSTIFKVFSNKYRKKHNKYYKAKVEQYKQAYPDGQPLSSIWKGNDASDAPVLTIYRHFDSASVHKGVIGEKPKTLWVIDYPQLERVYYSLVAGYDVFANVTHQTNIRRYTDFLRIEAEKGFLSYMPQDKQLELFKFWYIGDRDIQKKKSLIIENNSSAMNYKTATPQYELIEKVVNQHIINKVNIQFDDINYPDDTINTELAGTIKTKKDFMKALRFHIRKGSKFLNFMSDQELNLAFIRIKLPDNQYHVIYSVVNRWHDNVNSLFKEEKRLDSDKDSVDFLPMSVGSYPSMYVDINYKDFSDFFKTIEHYDDREESKIKIQKYLVNRSDKNFWAINDWFQDYFKANAPITSGLYDLNRYYRKVW